MAPSDVKRAGKANAGIGHGVPPRYICQRGPRFWALLYDGQ
jgi:hypothetical protein